MLWDLEQNEDSLKSDIIIIPDADSLKCPSDGLRPESSTTEWSCGTEKEATPAVSPTNLKAENRGAPRKDNRFDDRVF